MGFIIPYACAFLYTYICSSAPPYSISRQESTLFWRGDGVGIVGYSQNHRQAEAINIRELIYGQPVLAREAAILEKDDRREMS
jgi:hypothetical protein